MKIISILIVLSFCFLISCKSTTSTKSDTKSEPEMIKTPSGLQYLDIKVGTGSTAVSGKKVSVHYVGTLTNGTKFDSSRDRNAPFEFNLGAGQVIKGWDEGVAGMKVGGTRKLVIPPELGYGSRKMGTIPSNSILIFEVELLDVK